MLLKSSTRLVNYFVGDFAECWGEANPKMKRLYAIILSSVQPSLGKQNDYKTVWLPL